ncbi:Glycerol-3-phosphate acyltransferase, chloroplastic [Galdieria sulphuraria]|uniref:Glycerol-3-phosphate O-acyltransferase n=1 Tax=Galdieria sulphuraria TaxID=130081 RepID=M2Y025_GALSU|nr:glycerol-3-phosphate O-acyltransferase [Galdieria sulphuraria]EME29189.1 glycerol-3-phosphate O-acyltransferase [Galdieria sulphuraria]GJD11437.1 Glycerol-3-phosphate acyltransferase, chloroplastic [Galdieria sulphuraria]|eukprot:XP_005705709.1 glycerol-3-phosphate O-acyltransferase [Galdieria sulphuraria]
MRLLFQSHKLSIYSHSLCCQKKVTRRHIDLWFHCYGQQSNYYVCRRDWKPTCSLVAISSSHVTQIPLVKRLENYLSQARVPNHDQLTFIQRAHRYYQQGEIPSNCEQVLVEWYHSYLQAVCSAGMKMDPNLFTETMFQVLLELVRRCCQHRYPFEPFHQSIREPFDYLEFGLDFARPIVHVAKSIILGTEYIIGSIPQQLERGENVVFFSNHQSEGDPHAIHVLLEEKLGQGKLAEKIIFMAGDRVRDDPVAMPFSMGRNLLTVYSKRHINDFPETKADKLTHNRKTIAKMQQLLEQGGNMIWFAPSGGRDRRDSHSGLVKVADFVPESLELMRFVASQVKTVVHFYPMALRTWDLLPPPDHIQVALGEKRYVRYVPIGLAIGEPIQWPWMKQEPPNGVGKEQIRQERASHLHHKVKELYEKLGGLEQ